jgi:hypothetical protein
MEIIDCASDVLRSVIVTSSKKEAFADADIIVILEEDWQVNAELQVYSENLSKLIGYSVSGCSRKCKSDTRQLRGYYTPHWDTNRVTRG